MNRILVGIPSRGYIDPVWKSYFDRLFFPLAKKFVVGKDVATARLEIMEHAVREDYTHLLFLDDDVFPPPFVLPRLLKTMKMTDADLVNAPVWLKRDFGGVNLFEFFKITNTDGSKTLTTQPVGEPSIQVGGVESFDMGGLACTFLKVDILSRLEKPWLMLGYVGKEVRGGHELEYGTNVGEDFAFFTRCNDAGIKKVVDYGILCSHYEADEEAFYPKDYVREVVTGNTKDFHELPEPGWFLIERKSK